MADPVTAPTPAPAPYTYTPSGGGMPGAPDYLKLAQQTAASQAAATQGQTTANRPNQKDQYGNTSTWQIDPATGQWTQNIALGQQGQQFQDQYNQIRGGLMGQASSAMGSPLSTDGLQEVGPGMDATGNSQEIQDATYGLLAPQREMARNSEIQRLKNQGLTEDSPAFQRAMLRLGQGDTDAQLKSLLAGQQEYGNSFNRNLNQQQLSMALRGQQLGERKAVREQPLGELTGLMGLQAQNKPEFGQFMGAGNPGGVDETTAAQQQYNSSMSNWNAEQASKLSNQNALMGILGGLGTSAGTAGTPMNDLYKQLASLLKGSLGSWGSPSPAPAPPSYDIYDPNSPGYVGPPAPAPAPPADDYYYGD